MLLFYEKFGGSFQRYMPLYWYLTVCFTVPFFGTYMTMINQVLLSWWMHDVLGMFLLVLVVGVILGCATYLMLGGHMVVLATNSEIIMVLYMSIFAVVILGIFLRNKELIHWWCIDRAEVGKKIFKIDGAQRANNLKKSLAANRRVIASISHEVRTPFQGVIGISKLISDKWKKLGDNIRCFYIKLIAGNGDRLKSLINNLLEFSKFSAGKNRFHYEGGIDVLKIIEEVKEIGKALIVSEKKHLSLSIKVKHGVNRSIYCDIVRITQVITNLISNAIKYTTEGGITIYVDNAKSGVLVSVQN